MSSYDQLNGVLPHKTQSRGFPLLELQTQCSHFFLRSKITPILLYHKWLQGLNKDNNRRHERTVNGRADSVGQTRDYRKRSSE